MTLYQCARCKLPMPADRVPPPGATCFPCGAKERSRESGVSRGYETLQKAVARLDDAVVPALDDVGEE